MRSTGQTGRSGIGKLVMFFLVGMMLLNVMGCKSASEDPDEGRERSKLEEVLSRGAGIDGLSYRVVTHYPMWSYEVRVWIQGDQVKTETTVDGEAIISVINMNQGEFYAYDAAGDVVTRMSLGEGHIKVPDSPLDYVLNLEPSEWVPGDVAFLDGVRCLMFSREEPRGETVLYIWEEHGLPLRVEKTEDDRTTVIEFKEVEVGVLPEGTFDLPGGVQVMDF